MRVALVAAVARNGVIGARSGLPWRLPSDLKRFKALTTGKPVVMGRKTFQSIGKPLAQRANIVISRDPSFGAPGIDVASSLDAALILARARGRCMAGADEICVIGGGEIYRQALAFADRLYLTQVLADPPGDTYFPPVDAKEWKVVAAEDIPVTDRDSHPMRFVVYERLTGRG
jgi:dihydrofolate reductase